MIAATPKYLGNDFNTAPPGQRFGLYFQYWQENTWKAEDKRKREALKKNLTLPDATRAQIDALEKRQSTLIAGMPNDRRMTILAKSLSPLVTGMGMEHPLENGFAFLNPYGLPYLPGSSIKGVLRYAAQELIQEGDGEWHNEWVTALFGLETQCKADKPQRGALTFWDSIPGIAGGRLAMDVMTPHYSEYYQGKASPHDAGQPIPIVFMVIPPNSAFTFDITCEQNYLPEPLKGELWKPLMDAAFQHAFEWLGFGAKTAIGYGAMSIDQKAQHRRQAEEKEKALQREQEEKLKQETAGLPEDAVHLYHWRQNEQWMSDNNTKLKDLKHYLETNGKPTDEAMRLLEEIIDSTWKGILKNPRATQGKKNKPKFKPVPMALAEKIINLRKTS
jgi:CRISPR-associated protein Cmr6